MLEAVRQIGRAWLRSEAEAFAAQWGEPVEAEGKGSDGHGLGIGGHQHGVLGGLQTGGLEDGPRDLAGDEPDRSGVQGQAVVALHGCVVSDEENAATATDADSDDPRGLVRDEKALVGAALAAAGAFFGNVAAYVRELFLAGSLTLLGPSGLTPADLAVIEAQVNVQQGYLTSFEMEAAAADALDGTFAARAESYAASLWGNAQGTARQRIIDGGLAVEERRVHEGSDPPCQDCDDMIAEGWVAVGTLPDIGDSQCMFNCHCHFEYRSDVAPEPLLSVFDLIASQTSPYAGVTDDFDTIMLGPEPVAPAPVAPPPARAPRPAAPAPPPAPPPAVQPGGVPVSAALDVQVPGAFGQRLESAIAAIDSVHGDGNLPTIPIQPGQMAAHRGGQIGVSAAGVPRFININEAGMNPELAVVHEIGHLIDFGALQSPANAALMAPVQEALRNSEAAIELRRLATVSTVPATGLDLAGVLRAFDLPIDARHVAYLSTDEELWARAYAQYIATRSGDTTLMEQLEVRRGPGPLSFRYPEQWTDSDFAEIATAIDALFQRLGWLH